MRLMSVHQSPTRWQRLPSFRWTSEIAQRRILIVDDDPSLLSLMRILLISSNYEVDTASNGQLGLNLAKKNDYSLVLLDLEMPVMNGRQFFRAFRSEGYETPVVLISAFGAESARAELSANAAVSKPFDPTHLAYVVDSLVQNS